MEEALSSRDVMIDIFDHLPQSYNSNTEFIMIERTGQVAGAMGPNIMQTRAFVAMGLTCLVAVYNL